MSVIQSGAQLGEGLFKFRIRHTSAEIEHMFTGAAASRQAARREKVLLHVFCHAYGMKIVLLLSGYDKAGDPSDKRQQREITVARRRLVEFREQQVREHKRQRRGGGRNSQGRG
jgi:hypothetical protein